MLNCFAFEKAETLQIKQEIGDDDDDSNLDDLDDLTLDELKSLLDNFTNLSKPDQMDLIKYMRRLEKTNPQKVRQLKGGANQSSQNQPLRTSDT